MLLRVLVVLLLCDAIATQFIQVSPRLLYERDNVTLKCQHELPPEPAKYSWFFNNKRVVDDLYFHQDEDQLRITNVQKSLHSGPFYCILELLESGAKLETPHERLVILDKKAFNQLNDNKLDESLCSFRIPKLCRRSKRQKKEEPSQPTPLTVNETEAARLECKIVPDVLPGFTVRWLKDRNEAHFKFNSTTLIPKWIIDPSTHMLTITSVVPGDEGLYECALFSDSGALVEYSKMKYDLQINDKLKFSPKPTSRNLELGSVSKVHCKAAASTKTYWKAQNETLPENVEDINGTLIFQNVTLENRGRYTCVASKKGDEIQATININVVIAPKFVLTPPTTINVVEMQAVILDCSASGLPTPTIQWDHNLQYIVEEDDDRFKIFENGTLVLSEARLDDEGRYGCTIGNAAGLKREETMLNVKAMDLSSSYEENSKENGFQITKAVLITIIVAVAYIILVVSLMLYCRYKRQKNRGSEDAEKECDDTRSDEKEPLKHDPSSSPIHNGKRPAKVRIVDTKKNEQLGSASFTLLLEPLQVKRDKLIDLLKLGRGDYGEILSGRILLRDLPKRDQDGGQVSEDIQSDSVQRHILIKAINRSRSENSYKEFQRQIEMFKAINHEQVALLLGVSFEKDSHSLILEHSDVGDLKQFLLANASQSFEQVLQIAGQIALGLKAIASHNLTHRDIACRNCIVSTSSAVKISFPACRDKYANEYYKYKTKILPIRWMSPEALQKDEFSPAADVYSLGILVWELFTKAKSLPFEQMDNEEYLAKVDELDYGLLADKGPAQIKSLLLSCWLGASQRPTAAQIVDSISTLAMESTSDNK